MALQVLGKIGSLAKLAPDPFTSNRLLTPIPHSPDPFTSFFTSLPQAIRIRTVPPEKLKPCPYSNCTVRCWQP